MRKLLIAGGLCVATLAALPAAADAQVRCVNPQNNTGIGALVGAGGGAAVGSLLAGRHDRGKGAIFGALGGAVLGGVVGHGQTKCPDGQVAYDPANNQYYDNDGRAYQPQGGPGQGGYQGGQYQGGPSQGGQYQGGQYQGGQYQGGQYQGGQYQGGPPREGAYGPPRGGSGYWNGAGQGIRERTDFLEQRIRRDADNGRVSPRAADGAYADLGDIRRQEVRLRRRDGGHLNEADRAYLQDRLDRAYRNLHYDRQSGY